MKQAYITALTETLINTNDIDSALSQTYTLLQKKGHVRLWPAVLKGVIQELEKKEAADTPRVIVARESVKDSAVLKAALQQLSVVHQPEAVRVDDSLIGGFVVQYKDKMVDGSYKRALIDLYRKITK